MNDFPRQPSPANVPLSQLTEAEQGALRQLRALRFGTLEIQIHDGKIVQIERRERQRFDR